MLAGYRQLEPYLTQPCKNAFKSMDSLYKTGQVPVTTNNPTTSMAGQSLISIRAVSDAKTGYGAAYKVVQDSRAWTVCTRRGRSPSPPPTAPSPWQVRCAT
jgi:hypothetical protein